MDSELTFLLKLLLEQPLNKATKKIISERMTEVELSLRIGPSAPFIRHSPVTATPQSQVKGSQSPSMQAILDRNPDLAAASVVVPVSEVLVEPQQPAVIAHTPATASALAGRQEAIRIATSGKEEKGRTSPRKF